MIDWDATVDAGPPVSIHIIIPNLPPSLNVWSRQHWRVRHKLVDQMTEQLAFLKMRKKLPLLQRVEVQMVYYFRDKRHRDPDNYAPKFALDGLRRAGIIADDNATVLKLPQPMFKVDSKMPRTEVFIREIEDVEGLG